MRFRLVSPDRTLIDDEVISVSLPTLQGQITVLSVHAALASVLVAGIITVKREGKPNEEVAVSRGFIQIEENVATVLADTAERGEDLDVAVIEEAKQRAEQVMKSAASKDDVSFAMAAAALERELARYKLAIKYRRRP